MAEEARSKSSSSSSSSSRPGLQVGTQKAAKVIFLLFIELINYFPIKQPLAQFLIPHPTRLVIAFLSFPLISFICIVLLLPTRSCSSLISIPYSKSMCVKLKSFYETNILRNIYAETDFIHFAEIRLNCS